MHIGDYMCNSLGCCSVVELQPPSPNRLGLDLLDFSEGKKGQCFGYIYIFFTPCFCYKSYIFIGNTQIHPLSELDTYVLVSCSFWNCLSYFARLEKSSWLMCFLHRGVSVDPQLLCHIWHVLVAVPGVLELGGVVWVPYGLICPLVQPECELQVH